MRAFFCLKLESAIKNQIYRDFSHLRRSGVCVGWVRPENLHITLKFLGDIDSKLVKELEDVAANVIAEIGMTAPINITLDALGAFPSIERPRVVWLGCSKSPPMIASLVASLESHVGELGFEQEQRAFTAHVTLGRVKEQGRATAELTELMTRTPQFAYQTALQHLTLMESDLTPQGSIYSPLFQISFTK